MATALAQRRRLARDPAHLDRMRALDDDYERRGARRSGDPEIRALRRQAAE